MVAANIVGITGYGFSITFVTHGNIDRGLGSCDIAADRFALVHQLFICALATAICTLHLALVSRLLEYISRYGCVILTATLFISNPLKLLEELSVYWFASNSHQASM